MGHLGKALGLQDVYQCIKWRWMVSLTPPTLYIQGKCLGRLGHCGKDRNSAPKTKQNYFPF